MERGEVDALLNSLEHLVVDQGGFGKQFSAVHHAVPHRLNVRHGPDAGYPRCIRGYPSHQVIERLRNVWECRGKLLPRAVLRLDGHNRFSTNPLDLPAAQAHITVLPDAIGIGVVQLELQTGTSRIEYEDIHVSPPASSAPVLSGAEGAKRRCSVWPGPASHVGFVQAVLTGVLQAVELHVPELLLGVGPDSLQFGNTIDGVNGQAEAIDFVFNGQLQRRIDTALLFVTAHMQAVMVLAAVSQAVDQPW